MVTENGLYSENTRPTN